MLGALFRQRPLVLVICTANICRSPVAATMLRARLKALDLGRAYRVQSAGTRVAVAGQHPDPRMRELAARQGLSLRGEKATPLTAVLARRASLIVAMEARHLHEIHALLGKTGPGPEVRALGDWYAGDTGANGDIADPYFANRAALEIAFSQLDVATRSLARELASRHRSA